jgi:hypothetical protein
MLGFYLSKAEGNVIDQLIVFMMACGRKGFEDHRMRNDCEFCLSFSDMINQIFLEGFKTNMIMCLSLVVFIPFDFFQAIGK